jgi:FAD/FMN-containing dehydrogenase
MPLNDAGPAVLQALSDALGADALRPVDARYAEDPRGNHSGRGAAVVLPRDTGQIAAAVRICAAARVGIVPYAGGTGLVAGQLMQDGPLPVILSVERLNRVRSVHAEEAVLVAEAGVILSDIQRAAADAGLLFPLSLASQGSARIGGNLGTNAGGVNVLRYGNARDLCLGVEAVLADGSVLNGLKRLRKDNTGYDLRHLLVGSEGTLGIITAASLRLFPRPAETAVACVAVPSPAEALALLGRLRDVLGETVSAFELVHRMGLDFLEETAMPFRDPLDPRPDWMVLVETGGRTGTRSGLEEALAVALEAGMITDATLAQSAQQADDFWAVRETIPLANRRVGAVSSHDISVPVGLIPDFIDRAGPALAALDAGLRINCFGHVGDGNLHYNVYPPRGRRKEDLVALRPAVKRCVHDLVHSLGGSVSAEHGIGRAKVADLDRYGDPVRLAAMRAIKQALDPAGILNPGVLFPIAAATV